MNNRIVLLLGALLSLPLLLSAQREATVEGVYHMFVPEYMSREEARIAAIEQARLEALANEFGTMVSQVNLDMMEQENSRSRETFYSLGQCDVKGEWIKDLKDPDIKESIEDGRHRMTVRVKGLAREVHFAKVNFDSRLLRNGKSDEYEAQDFHDGDRFYISFRSPAKGYLAVYLLDAERNAFPIVPLNNEENFKVKRGERYVFIDDSDNCLLLTTDRALELNQVYVVFSPNKFYNDNVEEANFDNSLDKYLTDEYKNVSRLPYIPFKKFQKWISRLRDKDPEVQVVTKYIKIIGRERDHLFRHSPVSSSRES